MAEKKKLVGKVSHFYDKISVAVMELEHALKVGDRIAIQGHTTNFEQTVDSMQIHGKNVESAKKGESIGMKMADRVRNGDEVYLVEE